MKSERDHRQNINEGNGPMLKTRHEVRIDVGVRKIRVHGAALMPAPAAKTRLDKTGIATTLSRAIKYNVLKIGCCLGLLGWSWT
jgi:hypothetical protein